MTARGNGTIQLLPSGVPGLDAVLSADAIRAKVERSIAETNVLDVFWARSIMGDQLQAEMDRMAEQTRQPALLRELFHALGDDPRLIAVTGSAADVEKILTDRNLGSADYVLSGLPFSTLSMIGSGRLAVSLTTTPEVRCET